MPTYQAITHTDFAHRRWKPYDHYRFAAAEAIVPLVAQELAKACHSLPIAFIRQQDHFIPAAVQGLQPGQNLFVAPDGRWLGGYIPAAYRGYPFALAQADTGQLVLCVDLDSELIADQHEQPFFTDTGEPAQRVKDVLDFLQQVHQNRQHTQRLCAALEAEQLITAWPLKRQSEAGEQPIDGLYRIDEPRLNSLDSDALTRLHQAGALPVAYCQLLSMQHIHTLGKLAERQAQAKPALDARAFFGAEDSLSFDWDR
ncbi:MAG: SapC family protein [Lamprobacter sp.]|uniref:SapC family protein n=1 Tax=Lamprobacter sp. TaxID=3100796 RepID=UPI002B261392|nr:SapC family protein [Lamprobacter sp.]MEA3642712.1 SapC family protein [Lamprobacter sp.]